MSDQTTAQTAQKLSPSEFFTSQGIIDIDNPQITDIRWEQISQGLSRTARYNGLNGDVGIYSVAQHSVMGADALAIETGDNTLAGHFLLHDAHEAFVGDVTRPVKELLDQKLDGAFSKYFEPLKRRWDKAIHEAANISAPEFYDQQPLVNLMDERMLAFECRWFFPRYIHRAPSLAEYKTPKFKGVPKIWGTAEAELKFNCRLESYLGIIVR